MARKLTEKVSWVGKIDWELKRFHGDEYSTHRGSSYNAYLIRDRKTVLIDTAWLPFDHEFVNNLKREIDLKDIDALPPALAQPAAPARPDAGDPGYADLLHGERR